MFADIPFYSITQQDITSLVTRNAREDRRLDFKRVLLLGSTDQNVQLLRDVIAMANSDGGAIVYGIAEGDDEEAGTAVAVEGMVGNADEVSNTIDCLLRDCVDERIPGVLHRPIPLDDNRFAYVIRVPSSPLAPHMIAHVRTSSSRFFSRANTTNEPMSARQIKDSARRHDYAVEKAASQIEERVANLRARGPLRHHPFGDGAAPPDQAVLHVLPLFPHSRGWNYGDPGVAKRLTQVKVFGYGDTYDRLRYTQYGAFLEFDQIRHVGFLRAGGIEFQHYDILRPDSLGGGTAPVFVASELEKDIDQAFNDAEALTRDGLLPTPVLIQLRLLDIQGAGLQGTGYFASRSGQIAPDAEVTTDAFLLNGWDERNQVLRDVLDHLWQAWGAANCPHFSEQGELIRFDSATDGG